MTRGTNERQPVTNHVIPEAAVEAGMSEVDRVLSGELVGGAADTLVRVILEASAPHFLAAYADVFEEGAEAGEGKRPRINPYRTTK